MVLKADTRNFTHFFYLSDLSLVVRQLETNWTNQEKSHVAKKILNPFYNGILYFILKNHVREEDL
jgi:hypothetical protein